MFRHPSITTTPSRTPQMIQDAQSMKPPKPPDRPLVPYMRFSRKMWAKVRAENADRQLWDIGKVIGQMWREAPEAEKAIYQHEYDMEKIEYDKSLKAYHNSSAYQMYLAAKNRAKQMSDKSSMGGGMMPGGGSLGAHFPASARGGPPGRLESGGVVIQPVDEEDSGVHAEISQRRLAAIRFDRNHRLIADLFSSTAVTDSRTVVSKQRIEQLKDQAQKLAVHQSKLEDELHRLEEAFNEKKRLIDDCSEKFAAQLKKVCEEKPQADEAKFAEMVDEWSTKLMDAYGEYKRKQEDLRAKQKAESEQMADQTPILYRLTCTQPSPAPESTQSGDATSGDAKLETNGEIDEEMQDAKDEEDGEEDEEGEDGSEGGSDTEQ